MTITEIAKLAGVSISTVSKIVNKKDENINPETRSRVLEIVKKYNYSPYGAAKSSSGAKTFLIGVLLNESDSFDYLLHGIIKASQERGYGILVFHSGQSFDEELRHITSLCKNKADGVLWEPVGQDSLQYEHLFSSAGIPVSFINTAVKPTPYAIDYTNLGYLCAERLIHYGHSKIGYLGRENDYRCGQVLEGIKNCLFMHHFTPDNVFTLYPDEALPSLASNYITGIIGYHYDDTLSLYEELRKKRLNVPADISLIALQTDQASTYRFPSISAYTIPYESLGYQACLELISICEKNELQPPSFSQESQEPAHEKTIAVPPYLKSRKFVVIGSINNDVCLTVDSFPETGQSTIITNSFSYAGGKGTNQAIGAARMGHGTVLIGRVGKDAEAALIFDALNQTQFSAGKIYKDDTAQTGKAYVYILGNGDISITYIPGANLKLNSDDVSACKDVFQECEYCLISTDIPLDAAQEAARQAKEHSAKVILKPSAINALPEAFFQATDIFVPNKQEAAVFCPQFHTVEQQAEYFFQQGIPTVIITLGADGCYVKTKDLCRHFPAPDFPVVDSTGGADAFISALAAHLSDGYPLEKAVPISQYAAGFCISRQGVISALADRDTLHAYIAHTEPGLLDR